MKDNYQIKKEAKEYLGGLFENNWILLVAFYFLYEIIAAILAATGVGSVATAVVSGPVMVGLSAMLLRSFRANEKLRLKDVKEGFINNRFGKSFVMSLLSGVFCFLWSLLFIIPGIVKAIAYSMAPYIILDRPELSGYEALKESEKMMDGHKADYFFLKLSFIGWYIVGILCFGVGVYWVGAWNKASEAIFYEELREDYQYNIQNVNG